MDARRSWPGPDPRDITAWTLIQAGHVVARRFVAAFDQLGLTPTQFGVLVQLDIEPGLSGADLARRVLVTPQSISELIASLAALGLVTRDEQVGRGRRVPAHITASGQDVLRRAAALIDDVNGDAALGLTAERSRDLNELLHTVIEAGRRG